MGKRLVQFIAPAGHGKTTHLLAIQQRLPQSLYIYVPQERPYPKIPQSNCLLVDEADRLPWLSRIKLLSNRHVQAIAVHECMKNAFARFGRQVLSIDVSLGKQHERLHAILNRRIAASATGTGQPPIITLEQAEELVLRFGNDIRSIEDYLYEQIQAFKGETDGKMRFDD